MGPSSHKDEIIIKIYSPAASSGFDTEAVQVEAGALNGGLRAEAEASSDSEGSQPLPLRLQALHPRIHLQKGGVQRSPLQQAPFQLLSGDGQELDPSQLQHREYLRAH